MALGLPDQLQRDLLTMATDERMLGEPESPFENLDQVGSLFDAEAHELRGEVSALQTRCEQVQAMLQEHAGI